MSVVASFKCDVCGGQKQSTNHWWLLNTLEEYGGATKTFRLTTWDEDAANHFGVEHICSESCGSKALSKWMAKASTVSAGEPE